MIQTTANSDLARNSFHVPVTDADGNTIDSRKLWRGEIRPFF